MSKNASIAVSVLCIFAIGYMSWDLIAKKDSRSTELSTAEQGENMFPDMNDIASTSNTQKLDTSTVNEVSALKSEELNVAVQGENMVPDIKDTVDTSKTQKSDISTFNEVPTPKSEEENSVSVDSTKRTVSNEQFIKNLSTCTPSINTDRDYGIFPDDKIESDLVTLDWNLEIKSGSANDCIVNFGYALYDTKSVKQVEKITQCTFNFKDLSEKQMRVLYEDVSAAFSFNLTNKMLTLDTDKLSGAETMYLNEELSDLSKIDKETLKVYSEINEENINRVKCSDPFVAAA